MTDTPQDNISDPDAATTPQESQADHTAPAVAEADTTPLITDGPAPAQNAETAPQDLGSADAPAPAKGRSAKALVAALAVGAIVGGVSGAGVAAWAVSANGGGSTTTAAPASQNITVNDTTSVNAVTAVAAKVEPSVVTISVTGTSEAGTGSGVILSSDGYVLTNTHVVTLDGATATGTIQVTTADGKIYDATVVGTDPIVDLAVIKLKNASDLQPVSFADSSKLNVGETAVAIGAPLGLSNTVTTGIVSAINRSITIASSAVPDSSSSSDSDGGSGSSGGPFDFWNFDNGQGNSGQSSTATATISLPVVQTDAAINPGNSGGALLDENGKVIGINVAIASASDSSSSSGQSGSIGVGFAIPSNLAQRVASEIMKTGKATHGLLGASVTDVQNAASGSTVGALVKTVVSGGAAADAGIKAGDVITQFNGVPITGDTDLTAQVRFLAAGSSTTLSYVRDGKTTTVDVTLGTLK